MNTRTRVRIIVGNEHAYACITCTEHYDHGETRRSLVDIRLPAGKGVEAGLRQVEAEIHDQIAKLARRANIIRAAYTECTLPEVEA